MQQRIDLIALASLFILGAVIGAAFIILTKNTFFYQQFSPEVVMWACGRGFSYVVERPQALLDFLHGRQSSFDCRVLDLVQQTQAAGHFARKQLYLSAAVSVLWRLFGVRYVALWPLFALLHGAYAAGCFALTRLFFNRRLAFVLATLLALSPTAVGMLYALRDYSKAPFIIWGIVLLLLALRARTSRQAISLGALAGNRLRHDRGGLHYTHDLTAEERAEVEPLIPPAKPGGNKPTVNLREFVNGLMFILGSGFQCATSPRNRRRAAACMITSTDGATTSHWMTSTTLSISNAESRPGGRPAQGRVPAARRGWPTWSGSGL
jgi:transposase